MDTATLTPVWTLTLRGCGAAVHSLQEDLFITAVCEKNYSEFTQIIKILVFCQYFYAFMQSGDIQTDGVLHHVVY